MSCAANLHRKDGNLGLVLHGIKDLKLENLPMPEIRDNQVLLQMETVGICGSDVHYYMFGRVGPFTVESPMVMGHEAAGIVLECGRLVKNLQPGDRVAIEPQTTCRTCEFCKSGRYNLCPDCHFCATPPYDGNMCRYYAHDADFCFKLPDNLDMEHGSLMEPLSVGVHACRRAQISPGDSVLITGSGAIGLVNVLAAKARGASKITILDIDEFKLKKAREIGVDHAINIKDRTDLEAVKLIDDCLQHPPDQTIECSGQEQALRVAIEATKRGGKIILIGTCNSDVSLPMYNCVLRQLDILSIFRYVNDYARSIEMVSSGKADPKLLITHHFKLEDAAKAFELAGYNKEPFLKIMIHVNPKWQP